MRQGPGRNYSHLFERIGLEHFHFIQSADRHISELAIRVSGDIDVIGDGPGIDHLKHVERRPSVEHHRLPDVLESEPDLLAIGGRGYVRTEWTYLRHMPDDLMRSGGNDDSFRIETGADISVLAIG